MKSKNIAYIAILSAIALVVILAVHYLIPAKTVPLAIVSAIGLIVFYLIGWKGGLAFVVVVEILTFVLTGLSITFFALSVLFIPYIIYAYAIRKISYVKSKGSALGRTGISLAFFYITSLLLMLLSQFTVGNSSALYEMQEKAGIYLTALLFAIIALPADFFISQIAIIVVERLKKNLKK